MELQTLTIEQLVKEWFSTEQVTTTIGRNVWNVRSIARKLGVTTNKIYSILRKAEWCDAQESYTGDRKYYVYRYNG